MLYKSVISPNQKEENGHFMSGYDMNDGKEKTTRKVWVLCDGRECV